jgi:hypothetical protein
MKPLIMRAAATGYTGRQYPDRQYPDRQYPDRQYPDRQYQTKPATAESCASYLPVMENGTLRSELSVVV